MVHVVNYRTDDSLLFRVLYMLFFQGEAGVNAFFFLSAWGLCFSFENNVLLKFYKKRFVRIFPIYLLFCVFLFLLLPDVSNEHIPLLCCKHLTSYVIWVPNKDLIEWFIPSLILLYVVFPAIYKIIKKTKEIKFYMVLWLLILILCIPFFYVSIKFIHPFFAGRISVIILAVMCYFAKKEPNWNFIILLGVYAFLDLCSFQDCKFYFIVPLVLYSLTLVDYSKLPLKRFYSFCGKHSLEIYLGQNVGLFWYYREGNDNLWLDLLVGLVISALSAAFFYNIQKYFWFFCEKVTNTKT